MPELQPAWPCNISQTITAPAECVVHWLGRNQAGLADESPKNRFH